MKTIKLMTSLFVAVIFVFSLMIFPSTAIGEKDPYKFEADPVHVYPPGETIPLDQVLAEKSLELDQMIEEALGDDIDADEPPVSEKMVKVEKAKPVKTVYNFTHKDAYKEQIDVAEPQEAEKVIVVKAKEDSPKKKTPPPSEPVVEEIVEEVAPPQEVVVEEPPVKEEIVLEEVVPEPSKEEMVKEPIKEVAMEVDEPDAPQEMVQADASEEALIVPDAETGEIAEESIEVYVEEEEDYWNTEIKEQTIEEIQRNHVIDQAFKEAKAFVLPEPEVKEVEEEEEEAVKVMMTPQEVVASIVKEEMVDMKIDLDFDDTNLQDILMTLGATGEVNIVLDPVLKNSKLDLHLKQVSIEEALLLIANTYNLGFKKVGASLFITQKEKLKEENVVSKLFKLKNVSVAEAKEMVADLIDNVSYSNELNSLLVVGDPEDIIEVEGILAKIDKPQPQVVLEAKIIEINKDALKELGVDVSDSMIISYQESGRPVDFENVEDSPASAMEIFSIARNPIQLDTTIKMLENQNKAKVLSNPRITTLNDKEAEIFVGDRIPYTVSNVTGGTVTTDVRWVEPGIRLIITPTIIENDFVVVKVEPEVSFIFSFLGPNDEYPRVKTREATANVRIKDNQPFVIGGLLNQEDKQNLYKVPFLGDIPLLGNLFSYESHTIEDTELIITIIPKIVQSEE